MSYFGKIKLKCTLAAIWALFWGLFRNGPCGKNLQKDWQINHEEIISTMTLEYYLYAESTHHNFSQLEFNGFLKSMNNILNQRYNLDNKQK